MIDRRMSESHCDFGLSADLAGDAAVVDSIELQTFETIRCVREFQESLVGRSNEPQFMSWMDALQCLGQRAAVEHCCEVVPRNGHAFEYTCEAVPGAHGFNTRGKVYVRRFDAP
jgi:hypothetical protein